MPDGRADGVGDRRYRLGPERHLDEAPTESIRTRSNTYFSEKARARAGGTIYLEPGGMKRSHTGAGRPLMEPCSICDGVQVRHRWGGGAWNWVSRFRHPATPEPVGTIRLAAEALASHHNAVSVCCKRRAADDQAQGARLCIGCVAWQRGAVARIARQSCAVVVRDAQFKARRSDWAKMGRRQMASRKGRVPCSLENAQAPPGLNLMCGGR